MNLTLNQLNTMLSALANHKQILFKQPCPNTEYQYMILDVLRDIEEIEKTLKKQVKKLTKEIK